MLIEQSAQGFWYGERQMPIRDARVQHFLNRRDPLLTIRFGTRPAKLALTTERDDLAMLTVRTPVDRGPIGYLTTAEQLLHDRVDGRILGMGLFEGRPSVDKDLLEAVLLRLTSWCHVRECTQSSPLCQTITRCPAGKRKFLWDQVTDRIRTPSAIKMSEP